jgi:hypothetical protein
MCQIYSSDLSNSVEVLSACTPLVSIPYLLGVRLAGSGVFVLEWSTPLVSIPYPSGVRLAGMG